MQRTPRIRREKSKLCVSLRFFFFNAKNRRTLRKRRGKTNSAYLCDLISLRFFFFNVKNKRTLRTRREKTKLCVSLRSYFSALLYFQRREQENAKVSQRKISLNFPDEFGRVTGIYAGFINIFSNNCSCTYHYIIANIYR